MPTPNPRFQSAPRGISQCLYKLAKVGTYNVFMDSVLSSQAVIVNTPQRTPGSRTSPALPVRSDFCAFAVLINGCVLSATVSVTRAAGRASCRSRRLLCSDHHSPNVSGVRTDTLSIHLAVPGFAIKCNDTHLASTDFTL